MKFVFIAKHRNVWPVAWLCNALGVSRSKSVQHSSGTGLGSNR